MRIPLFRSGGDETPFAWWEWLFAPIMMPLFFIVLFVLAGASVVAKFWLREGHPAYPVFWDFAFVIAGPADGVVFIGSSSD